jgi:hypothetical protein
VISGVIALILAIRIFKFIKSTKEEYAMGLLDPNTQQ